MAYRIIINKIIVEKVSGAEVANRGDCDDIVFGFPISLALSGRYSINNVLIRKYIDFLYALSVLQEYLGNGCLRTFSLYIRDD